MDIINWKLIRKYHRRGWGKAGVLSFRLWSEQHSDWPASHPGLYIGNNDRLKNTHTHTDTHTHTHTHTNKQTNTQTHARTHAHTHTHTRARAHAHAHTHTHKQTNKQTNRNKLNTNSTVRMYSPGAFISVVASLGFVWQIKIGSRSTLSKSRLWRLTGTSILL